MAEPPKMDLKMLAMPAVFYLSRQIDMKDPEIINYLRMGFITVFTLLFGLYAIAYMQITSKPNKTKIWVPPKPQPKLPFGLGPPETPAKPEDYKATTYTEHEIDLIKSEIGSMAMSLGITLLMSYKFNIHLSLLMQSVMTPMNTIESLVLKKYILGVKTAGDGSNLYKELLKSPAESDDQTFSEVSPMMKKGEARVEEIPIDDNDSGNAKSKNTSSSSSAQKKAKTTSASELD